jgi:hypothetical protein
MRFLFALLRVHHPKQFSQSRKSINAKRLQPFKGTMSYYFVLSRDVRLFGIRVNRNAPLWLRGSLGAKGVRIQKKRARQNRTPLFPAPAD